MLQALIALTMCGYFCSFSTRVLFNLMLRYWSTECSVPCICRSFFSSTVTCKMTRLQALFAPTAVPAYLFAHKRLEIAVKEHVWPDMQSFLQPECRLWGPIIVEQHQLHCQPNTHEPPGRKRQQGSIALMANACFANTKETAALVKVNSNTGR